MNIQHLRQSVKAQWLDYYRQNREWLTRLGVWITSDGKRRPSSSFILATLTTLEPQLTQLLPLIVDLTGNPDRIIAALGLNFNPDDELKELERTEQRSNGQVKMLPSQPAFVEVMVTAPPQREAPTLSPTTSNPKATERPVRKLVEPPVEQSVEQPVVQRSQPAPDVIEEKETIQETAQSSNQIQAESQSESRIGSQSADQTGKSVENAGLTPEQNPIGCNCESDLESPFTTPDTPFDEELEEETEAKNGVQPKSSLAPSFSVGDRVQSTPIVTQPIIRPALDIQELSAQEQPKRETTPKKTSTHKKSRWD